MSGVRHCAVVGGGVIGAGWAARMLANGLDVTVHDPAPDIERGVGTVVANAVIEALSSVIVLVVRNGARRQLLAVKRVAEGRP